MNPPAYMTDAQYREAVGVSSHMLADYRKSPRYFYRKHIMRVLRDGAEPWKAFGRAYHALALEGREGFERDFVIAPDEYVTEGGALSTAKAAKAWAAEQKANAKTPICPRDAETCAVIAERVRANDHMKLMLSLGQPEVVRFSEHAESRLPIKGRADLVGADWVCDLKGCYDLDTFADDARKYQYAEQLAHYCTLFNVKTGYLCAVEKAEPHRVGLFRVAGRILECAQARNDRAMLDLAESYARDEWRGDPESIIDLELAI